MRHPFDQSLSAVYSPLTGDDDSRWRLTVISIMLGLCVLASLGIGGYQLYQEIMLERRGVEASAVVREVFHGKGRRTVVELPDGRQLSYKRPKGATPTPGQRVVVRYDPQDLGRARDAREGFRAGFLVILALGALTFGYMIQQDLTLHRRMRRNPRTNLYELI